MASTRFTGEQGQGLLLRGDQQDSSSLEELANYLRDLVFLHDRLVLWELGYNSIAESHTYPFYSRYSRRELRELQLQVKRLGIGSPFELLVSFPAALVAPSAVAAFVLLIRQLAMLGPDRSHRQAEAELLLQQARRLELDNEAFARAADSLEDDQFHLGMSQTARDRAKSELKRLAKGPVLLREVQEVQLPDDDNATN